MPQLPVLVELPVPTQPQDAIGESQHMTHGDGAEQDQKLGIGQLDMAMEEGKTGRGFLGRGIAILRRPPVEHIGDVDLAPVETDCAEIMRPSGVPSAKTVFFAVRFSSQPSKFPSAVLSSARVVQDAAKARAAPGAVESETASALIFLPSPCLPAEASAKAGGRVERVVALWREDGSGRGDARANRLIGCSPMASSAPASRSQRKSERVSSRVGSAMPGCYAKDSPSSAGVVKTEHERHT